MPRWVAHAKNFTALRRRYSVNSPFSSILDAFLPSVQVDRTWSSEDLDVYGMLVQAPLRSASGGHLSCTLRTGETSALVRRVEFWLDSNSPALQSHLGFAVHMITPSDAYDPFDRDAFGSFFPWVQGGKRGGRLLNLPRAFGEAGTASALQTVTVNGVPIITIGPTIKFEQIFTIAPIGGHPVLPNKPGVFIDYQDPPLRLKPLQRLLVQFAVFAPDPAPNTLLLNVNFWWSERPDEGDVG